MYVHKIFIFMPDICAHGEWMDRGALDHRVRIANTYRTHCANSTKHMPIICAHSILCGFGVLAPMLHKNESIRLNILHIHARTLFRHICCLAKCMADIPDYVRARVEMAEAFMHAVRVFVVIDRLAAQVRTHRPFHVHTRCLCSM